MRGCALRRPKEIGMSVLRLRVWNLRGRNQTAGREQLTALRVSDGMLRSILT